MAGDNGAGRGDRAALPQRDPTVRLAEAKSEVAAEVERERIRAGIPQVVLARLCGRRRSTVRAWEDPGEEHTITLADVRVLLTSNDDAARELGRRLLDATADAGALTVSRRPRLESVEDHYAHLVEVLRGTGALGAEYALALSDGRLDVDELVRLEEVGAEALGTIIALLNEVKAAKRERGRLLQFPGRKEAGNHD